MSAFECLALWWDDNQQNVAEQCKQKQRHHERQLPRCDYRKSQKKSQLSSKLCWASNMPRTQIVGRERCTSPPQPKTLSCPKLWRTRIVWVLLQFQWAYWHLSFSYAALLLKRQCHGADLYLSIPTHREEGWTGQRRFDYNGQFGCGLMLRVQDRDVCTDTIHPIASLVFPCSTTPPWHQKKCPPSVKHI